MVLDNILEHAVFMLHNILSDPIFCLSGKILTIAHNIVYLMDSTYWLCYYDECDVPPL